jgi:hypothetical protein
MISFLIGLVVGAGLLFLFIIIAAIMEDDDK